MAFLKGLSGSNERNAFMDEYNAMQNTQQDVFTFITTLYDKYVELKLRYANSIAAMIGINAVTEASKLNALREEQLDTDWMMQYLSGQIMNVDYSRQDMGITMFHIQMIESGQLTTDKYLAGFYKDLVALMPKQIATTTSALSTAQTQYAAVQSVVEGLKAQLQFLQILITKEQEKQVALLNKASALGIMV